MALSDRQLILQVGESSSPKPQNPCRGVTGCFVAARFKSSDESEHSKYGVLGLIPALRRTCGNLEFDPRSHPSVVESTIPSLFANIGGYDRFALPNVPSASSKVTLTFGRVERSEGRVNTLAKKETDLR